MEQKSYAFEFTVNETSVVRMALGRMPHDEVWGLINKIHEVIRGDAPPKKEKAPELLPLVPAPKKRPAKPRKKLARTADEIKIFMSKLNPDGTFKDSTDDAPFGYKKDGTPKKRPGRPARKA